MTIKEIKEKYGEDDISEEGSWMVIHNQCPVCKIGNIHIEINKNLEAATQKEVSTCDKCNAEFKVGYIFNPKIILEQIK